MGQSLDKLTIKGFKSIKSLEDFELKKLNVMIGGNGAGKSNFVSFLEFVKEMSLQGLQVFIGKNGGAYIFPYLGPKVTESFYGALQFGHNTYQFSLGCTVGDKLIYQHENVSSYDPVSNTTNSFEIGVGGNYESALKNQRKHGFNWQITNCIYPVISNWVIYHFHDTSNFAKLKLPCLKQDYEHLRPDAGNLAAFLLRLKNDKQKEYASIKEAVQLAAPFIEDFILKDHHSDSNKTLLECKQKGIDDYPFQPNQISDGTLRFICLATALLQPSPPPIIILDEPELGLHPYAIEILAELIKSASQKTQVIVSTQSPQLIDNFNPEDIIVVNREQGASTFKRLEAKELSEWMKEYSLGELWRKNIIAGGPVHE